MKVLKKTALIFTLCLTVMKDSWSNDSLPLASSLESLTLQAKNLFEETQDVPFPLQQDMANAFFKENQIREGEKKFNKGKVNLQYSGITTLSLSLCYLTSLTELILTSLQLKEMPEEICQLRNLRVFNAHRNKLERFPEGITHITLLEKLYLSENPLQDLPEELGNLSCLKELVLRKTQLSTLPARFGELKKLEKLDLSDNQFTELPSTLNELENLMYFEAWGNALYDLPKLDQLTKLTQVYLFRNDFTAFPLSLFDLPALTILCLSNNKISLLPPDMTKLKTLSSLNLENNLLKSISPLLTVTSIGVLRVSGNPELGLPWDHKKHFSNIIFYY